MFVESVVLLVAFGVLVCRILDCASFAVWTVIKQVALFTFEDRVTGILRTGLSETQKVAYVSPFWSIACSFDDSKVQTQTRPVLSGCEMTRFCYRTRSIIHNVHKPDFEIPWLLYVNREQLHFFRCIWTTFY